MTVPAERLDKEFFELAAGEEITDIEELNRVLDRAVGLRTFLSADDRVDNVAAFVAKHFQENVLPLGYKAFLVAVDRAACAKYKNVEVTSFDGLQVDFARASGATFIVRGIRALSDFEFEFEMANMNRSLAAGIEMVYLMTAPEYLFVSASRVKELAAFGAPIDKYVPANVAKRLKAEMGKRGMRTGATEAND